MYLQTSKFPWISLRDAVASDDSAITKFDYSTDWPSSGTVNLKDTAFKDANSVMIAAFGTDADNEDMAYKLYGRARMNGPIVLLLTGIMTCGAQLVTKHPITAVALTARWVDTITVTGGLLSGTEQILDSTNNMIAMLKVDGLIFRDLFLEVDLDGGSTTMASFYSIICGY